MFTENASACVVWSAILNCTTWLICRIYRTGLVSAFTVSLLQTLHCFKGEFLTPIQLAYEAIYLERKILKDNVGCQDQTLAAFGGFNLIRT